jgi:hypothetical protein
MQGSTTSLKATLETTQGHEIETTQLFMYGNIILVLVPMEAFVSLRSNWMGDG